MQKKKNRSVINMWSQNETFILSIQELSDSKRPKNYTTNHIKNKNIKTKKKNQNKREEDDDKRISVSIY